MADSYYGRPILKEPVWKWEIPIYFFTGGLAGASASLALGARLAGDQALERTATLVAAAAVTTAPPLLIADLGRPARFLNMLRVAKVTSPMSVGTWVLSAAGTAMGVAGLCELAGVLPRIRHAAGTIAGVLGLPLSTYTGALVADTSVPAWHEARRELPFVFAGGAAASAGAAVAMLAPQPSAGPARRLALAGAALELAAGKLMERRLGPILREPYEQGTSGTLSRLAKASTALGAGALLLRRRRVGGALLLAGSALERWAVFRAGFASAADPRHTVIPQRERKARAGQPASSR
jgi:hypothetical protein